MKTNRKISRREFAKMAGGAALVLPAAPALAWPRQAPKKPEPAPAAPPQAEPPKPEPKPKLTAKQEEALKQAIERRDRQLATMRSRVLPYDLEPAFVFQVRQRPRATRKPAM